MRTRQKLKRRNKSSAHVFSPFLFLVLKKNMLCSFFSSCFYSVLFLQGTLYKELNSNIQVFFSKFLPY